MLLVELAVVGGVGLGIGFALGRFAAIGVISLVLLGVLPMAALYFYQTFIYETGDTSAYGMGATIALIMFVPMALAVYVGGKIRGD